MRKIEWICLFALLISFTVVFSVCDNGSISVPTTYTVTFQTNGGSSIESQTVEEGAQAVRPANPTKNGFTFGNWYADAELTTVFDFDTPINNDITLYAKWLDPNDPNTIFTIRFNSNGGSVIEDQLISEGNTASRPQNPSKSGFGFAGWFSDEGLTMGYNFDSPVTQNITLYAKWDTNFFTVSFNSMGGSSVESQNIAHNTTATKPNDPILEGSVFDNWYIDIELQTVHNFDTPITGNITLYAKWLTPFTVTFNSNVGSEVPAQIVGEGKTASRPQDPTRTGFIFGNWYIDAELVTVYNFDISVTGNITLYAKWLSPYTVSFNSNGGSFVTDQIIGEGRTVNRPQNPVRTGYDFTSWFIDEGLTIEYDFNTPVTQDITLYAKWNINFNIDDFGTGATIDGEFTVSNATEWADAISVINAEGNGTAVTKKNYIINIVADFALPGIDYYVLSWSTDPTFTSTYINISLRGKDHTMSLSSNGAMILLDTNQNLIIRDITLKGRNMTSDGGDNTQPLLYIRGVGVTLELKGDATITGNGGNEDRAAFHGCGIRFESNGTLIIQDNAKIHGNDFMGVSMQGGSIIMRDNAAIFNNENGIGGTWNTNSSNTTVTMQDQAKVYGNSGSGISCGDFSMIDNATVYNNDWTGVQSGNAIMSHNARIYENGGDGIWATNLTMTDYATIIDNMGGGASAYIITMNDNALITRNDGRGVTTIGYGLDDTIEMNDNAEISYNTGGGVYSSNIIMNNNSSIVNNSVSISGTLGGGGGVLLPRGLISTLIMNDKSLISGNISENGNGGGIGCANEPTSMSITTNIILQGDARITNNRTISGGGIYIGGGTVATSSLIIKDNVSIDNNTATDTGGGICIFGLHHGTPTILTIQDNAIIKENTANQAGGLYFGHIEATICGFAKVVDNTARQGGGVMAVASTFTMQNNSSISNNTATGDYAAGGGVYLAGSTTIALKTFIPSFIMRDNATVSNNIVLSNTDSAIFGGGGIYATASGDWKNSLILMHDNTTVSGNIAPRGGGVFTRYDGFTGNFGNLYMLRDSKISGNTASIEGGGVYTMANTYLRMSGGTIYGNNEGEDSNVVKNGNTNINGMGAALFKETNAVTQYGTFSADGETFTSSGNLSTTDNTIRVENGVLQP